MDDKKYQPTAAFLAADMVHVCLSDHQASENLKGLCNLFVYSKVLIKLITVMLV